MKSGKQFDDFKNDSMLKEFLDGIESQNRWNIMIINSLSEHLKASKDPDTAEAGRVIGEQCLQMMKMVEVYSMISASVSNDDISEETIELQKELGIFKGSCTELLRSCRLELTEGETAYTSTIKKLFVFILVLYVRSSVLKGASAINISSAVKDDSAEIILKVVSRSLPVQPESMTETFTLVHAFDMMETAAEKINAKLNVDEDEMHLVIPIKNDGKTLNCPEKTYGKARFNIYSNLLSDLSNMTNI